MVNASSGSTIATSGNIPGWIKLMERLASQSQTAAPAVTSLLLPEVVGTAMKGTPWWEIFLSPAKYSSQEPS